MGKVSRCLSAVSVFLALAILTEVSAGSTDGGFFVPTGAEGSVPMAQCPDKFEYRCSATSHKKPCLFFCNYCCQTCLCVPSGTVGNKECPCYNNMKTKEGDPKCP